MTERLSLEDRDLSLPPADSLAEGIVLRGILADPQRIEYHDLRPLLLFPEHRWCYDAMRRVWAEHPGASVGDFFVHWDIELRRAYPERWYALGQLVLDAHEDETQWMFRRHDDDVERDPDIGHRVFAHLHEWEWWVRRLERVAEARRVIDFAQRTAERAWHMDISGSLAVASQIVALHEPPPVWRRADG